MFRKIVLGSLMVLGVAGATLSSGQAAGVQPGSGAAIADMGGSTVLPVWHYGRSHFGFGFGFGPGYWGPGYYGPGYYHRPRCHWQTRRVWRNGKRVRVQHRVCW